MCSPLARGLNKHTCSSKNLQLLLTSTRISAFSPWLPFCPPGISLTFVGFKLSCGDESEPDNNTWPITLCFFTHDRHTLCLALIQVVCFALLLVQHGCNNSKLLSFHFSYVFTRHPHKNCSTWAVAHSFYLAFTKKEIPHASVFDLPTYSTVAGQRRSHLINQPKAKQLEHM